MKKKAIFLALGIAALAALSYVLAVRHPAPQAHSLYSANRAVLTDLSPPQDVEAPTKPVVSVDTLPPAKVAGYHLFQRWCANCHGDGPGQPGTVALQTKYNGQEPALLEKRKDLSPELVQFIVRNGIATMPPFRKTEISDQELSDLINYLTFTKK